MPHRRIRAGLERGHGAHHTARTSDERRAKALARREELGQSLHVRATWGHDPTPQGTCEGTFDAAD